MSTPEVKGITPEAKANTTEVTTTTPEVTVTTPEVKAATVEQKGSWDELKGKLKTKFPTLTDADLQFEESKKDEMLGKIQSKLGKTKEEFTAIVAAL